VVAFGVVAFSFIGALGLGYSVLAGKAYPGAIAMVFGTLLAGLMAVAIAIPVSYYIAVGTSRRGWDPDNFCVPWITSVMDLSGTIVFLLALAIFGVSFHV
jgi:mgtE-like transporter